MFSCCITGEQSSIHEFHYKKINLLPRQFLNHPFVFLNEFINFVLFLTRTHFWKQNMAPIFKTVRAFLEIHSF